MKTPHKHAELIKAWADGAQIQYKSQLRAERGWVDDRMPSFDVDYEWRIKPEPKPDVSFYGVAINESGIARIHYLGLENSRVDNNLRLTFDGETGALKAAEVLK